MSPYLRIAAGVGGWVFVCAAVGLSVETNYSAGVVSLLIGGGLWWLAVAGPLRARRARRARAKANLEAMRGRADAGHEAFLRGDPAAFAPPPPVEPEPAIRAGIKVALWAAVGFCLLFTLVAIFGGPAGTAAEPASIGPAAVAGR